MRNILLNRKCLYLTFTIMLLTCGLPRTVLSQAVTTTTIEIVPAFRREFVPCANGGAGEIVEVTGILHLQAHVTINPKWSIATFNFRANRLIGVGLTSGDVYRGVDGNHFGSLSPRVDETLTFGSTLNFQLIGPDNKLQMHTNTHTTINANGDVTSTVRHISIDCK